MFAAEELAGQAVVLKDMRLGSQAVVQQGSIVEEVKRIVLALPPREY